MLQGFRKRENLKKIAAIDMGSNAIRLAIANVRGKGHIELAQTTREPVRLGKAVFSEGLIDKKTMRQVLKIMLKFKKILKKERVQYLRSVATSAVREALNQKPFIRAIEAKTGIPVDVIDGREEARLIFESVQSFIDLKNQKAVLLDIGGGSLEITLVYNGRAVASKSFPIGTVRSLSKTRGQALAIEKLMKVYKVEIESFLNKEKASGNWIAKNHIFVGTGGNIECLGRMRSQFMGRSSPNFLKLAELRQMVRVLKRLTVTERMKKLNLRADRADVILPAAMALQMIMECVSSEDIIIPFVGLKDGVLLDLSKRISHSKLPKKIVRVKWD
jgi:exopolyphosphatase/guanosine-5'-triphosphate,3'-diphosphate pyrophosphatase